MPRIRKNKIQVAALTMAEYKQTDEGMANWFNTAYGYAVFPSIGKGGLGIGGALGHGVVYKAAAAGGVKMSQVSVGFQVDKPWVKSYSLKMQSLIPAL